MARLDALPSIDIIHGFKGILDFYLWKGLPCVRSWPRMTKAQQSPATIAAGVLFGQILKSYRLLADTVLAAFREEAANQPRTARDLMVAAVLGHLHEASMSDFLTLLTECRNSLLALEAFLGALHSVDTDQILVRGMDQLYSVKDVLGVRRDAALSGNDGYIASTPATAGEIWKVTSISGVNRARATTGHRLIFMHLGSSIYLGDDLIARDADVRSRNLCEIWMAPTDTIRCYFSGGLANDACRLALAGHRLTLET